MDLKTLNNKQLENLNEIEVNGLIIESLFPSERNESKYYTIPNKPNRFPMFVSKNEFHD